MMRPAAAMRREGQRQPDTDPRYPGRARIFWGWPAAYCALALSLTAGPGTPADHQIFERLSHTSMLEVPDAAAKLVADAPPAQRMNVARDVIRTVAAVSPSGVMPFAVSKICKQSPEVAPEVAQCAARQFPLATLAITQAAITVAPEQARPIVEALSRAEPKARLAIMQVAAQSRSPNRPTVASPPATKHNGQTNETEMANSRGTNKFSYYDSGRDFTTNRNPNGVWRYGYSIKAGGDLHFYDTCGQVRDPKGVIWNTWGDADPRHSHVRHAYVKNTNSIAAGQTNSDQPVMILMPATSPTYRASNECAVLRFVAPETNVCMITATVSLPPGKPFTEGQRLFIVMNGVVITNLPVQPEAVKFMRQLRLLPGTAVDFAADFETPNADTGISLQVNVMPSAEIPRNRPDSRDLSYSNPKEPAENKGNPKETPEESSGGKTTPEEKTTASESGKQGGNPTPPPQVPRATGQRTSSLTGGSNPYGPGQTVNVPTGGGTIINPILIIPGKGQNYSAP